MPVHRTHPDWSSHFTDSRTPLLLPLALISLPLPDLTDCRGWCFLPRFRLPWPLSLYLRHSMISALPDRYSDAESMVVFCMLIYLSLARCATRVWHQGCHNGAQLERELRAKGYKGSQKAIYRSLATLALFVSSPSKRSSASASGETESQPNLLLTLSAPQATWLFFRKEEDLKAEEQESLRQLRQASPHLETAYQLVEAFLHMVRERTGEQLDAWLGAVQASHLKAFQSFVTGVQQDKDAVLAGLTLPWSNDHVA